MWQDVVIGTGLATFVVALVPMLFDRQKPSLHTSVPTAITALVLAATMSTLDLWWSTVVEGALGGVWATLAWQRLRQ